MRPDLEALAREDLGPAARPELVEAWIAGYLRQAQAVTSGPESSGV